MSDETPLDKDPVVEAYKRDLDRTLFRANLRLTLEERFLNVRETWKRSRNWKQSKRIQSSSSAAVAS